MAIKELGTENFQCDNHSQRGNGFIDALFQKGGWVLLYTCMLCILISFTATCFTHNIPNYYMQNTSVRSL